MPGGRTVHWGPAYQIRLTIFRCPCRRIVIGYEQGIALLAVRYWVGCIMNMC